MARRTRLSSSQVAAFARQAVDKVEEAEDTQAAAEGVLEDAPDAGLRQAIVEMSAAAADHVTAAVVRAALGRGEPYLARIAADLLLDTSDSPFAYRVLEECLDSEDATVRCRAVEGLEAFSDPKAVGLLSRALTDDADVVRRSATVALGIIVGTMHHPLRAAVLEQLADTQSELSRGILANGDVQVRRQAAQGLAFAGSEVPLTVLRALSHDEDTEVRQEVVLALQVIGTEEAGELMAECLHDASYRVASTVLDALAAQLGANSAAFLEQLKRAMKHPVAEVRRHAVLMLSRFSGAEVADVLRAAAGDADFEVARRAGELLRRVWGDRQVDWLEREMQRQAAGGKAFSVWEAGNIGLGAEVGTGPAASARSAARADAVAPMLEQVLRDGSPSDRVHAMGELATLVDIGDSPTMQAALDDDDSSVRSRAADTLTYTRNAGLLARVLQSHPDAQVRRRAVAALVGNPGGPKLAGSLTSRVSFASTRTVGLPLFGCFLRALSDQDAGVVQTACAAIRECAQTVGLCPVRETVAELERLANDDSLSFLLQEEAANAADVVEKTGAADLVADAAEAVLEWRGGIAREAHSVAYSGGGRGFGLDAGIDTEVVERWIRDYRLSDADADGLRRAVAQGTGLEPKAAGRVLYGLTRDLQSALDCMAHAARVLALIGQAGLAERVEKWSAALQVSPGLNWGPGHTVGTLLQRLRRARMNARLEVQLALQAIGSSFADEGVQDLVRDEDDWLRLMAFSRMSLAPANGHADRVISQCREHCDDEEYAEPVGRCAIMLLRAGRQDAVELVRRSLAAADTDLRLALCQLLLIAAQEDAVAAALGEYLVGQPMADVSMLCMALALRGAGNGLDGVQLPEVPETADDEELACAALALGAMENDAESARRLVALLRSGRPKERYCSVQYLSLARVRSAIPTLASVRDQDVPALLRGLCGATLVRHGYGRGLTWFHKALESTGSQMDARFLALLCRAIEDIIPLMLNCRDVNVGRFV